MAVPRRNSEQGLHQAAAVQEGRVQHRRGRAGARAARRLLALLLHQHQEEHLQQRYVAEF